MQQRSIQHVAASAMVVLLSTASSVTVAFVSPVQQGAGKVVSFSSSVYPKHHKSWYYNVRRQTVAAGRDAASEGGGAGVTLQAAAPQQKKEGTVYNNNKPNLIVSDDLGRDIFLSELEESKSLPILNQQGGGRTTKSESALFQNAQLIQTVGAVLAASEEAIVAVDTSYDVDVESMMQQTVASVATKIVILSSSENVSKQEKEEQETTPISLAADFQNEGTILAAAPSVRKILRFAVPAIGVWLCGPLLSLIDTSSVGILSGTVQQAALNPAVAVTDYAALLIAFLYTGTTNLVAAARGRHAAKKKNALSKLLSTSSPPPTIQTLTGVLQLSTYVGASLGFILFLFARVLLRAIIGNDAISPQVFDAAMKYVRIRALGMPAAAVIGSAQAACLGMQDIKSPLYVLLAAAVVNFMGDMMFVPNTSAWIGGAAGAAWATVFSQYAAVAFFMHWLCHKPTTIQQQQQQQEEDTKQPAAMAVNLSSAILELTTEPSSSGSAGEARRRRFRDAIGSLRMKKKHSSASSSSSEDSKPLSNSKRAPTMKSKEDESFSVRGILDGRFKKRDLLKLPPKTIVDDFKEYVVPVTSTQVGRVSGYVAMSHVVSSSLGTMSMAAQQVIVSLFYCLCPIADSLSLTAQSFVPAIAETSPSPERTLTLRRTIVNFLKAGGLFGGIMAAAVSCIPLLSGFFTTDPIVVALVNSVAPLLVGFFIVHGLVCSAEGLLLGQKDLSFLGRMYASFFAVVPLLMMRVKRAALLEGTKAVHLTDVWKVFVGYQLFRATAWVARVGLLHWRTERQTAKLETATIS